LREAQANSATGYKIEAAPDVIVALKGALANTVKTMEKANGYTIKLKADANFGDEAFQVTEVPKKKK
jgi:hypothetical protein